MSYCLYELAKNKELQQKIYEEIVSILENQNNRITYDLLSEMKCLENCIDGKNQEKVRERDIYIPKINIQWLN